MVSAAQEVIALFGQPVAGNPTQEMIERAFAKKGLDWRYISLDVSPEDLGDAIRGMRAMGLRGANITKPHKIEVMKYLSRLTQAASLIGAVNCIYKDGSAYVGENTDGKGFLESLQAVTNPAGKRVTLLGAGGAARAIGVELALAGAGSITVVNRNAETGCDLANLIQEKVGVSARHELWTGEYEVPADTQILINATSVGMNNPAERVSVNMDQLPATMVVADVVINPPDTLFLKEARAKGCQTLNGLGMLVNQGAIGFKLWTGLEPDTAVMQAAIQEALGMEGFS